MMWQMFTTRRSPIGLDIGARVIKAAQVSRRGGRAKLEAALLLERAEPGRPFTADEAGRLREVLGRRGFTGRSVVAAVPRLPGEPGEPGAAPGAGEAVLTSVLSLPPASSGAPLEQIARAEMGRTHRCDPASLEVAFWEVPEPARSGEGTAVMAAACAHRQSEALLDALEAQGFDVAALDLDGWAVARACRPLLRGGGGGMVAAVDIGWQAATLVLLHRQTVIYQRSLGGGGLAALKAAVEREHGLPPAVVAYLLQHVGFDAQDGVRAEDRALASQVRGPLEAHAAHVARELRLSMAYAAHQYPAAPVARLLLTGGGAGIPGLAAHLGSQLEVDAVAVCPADVGDCAPTLEAEARSPALTHALGLALYEQRAPGPQEEAA